MTSKNKTTSTPDTELIPAPTAGEADMNNISPPLDVRSTVSNPLAPEPTTILAITYDVTINSPIPSATNTSVNPTESFKTIVSDITESLTFRISPITYQSKIFILHLEDINQEFINSAANFKSAVPHPNINLLIEMFVPLKILTGYPKYHQIQYSTSHNINPDLKSEATIETHCFQMSNIHVADTVPPPTQDGSCAMTYFSSVCISENMIMHLVIFTPTSLSFPTNKIN